MASDCCITELSSGHLHDIVSSWHNTPYLPCTVIPHQLVCWGGHLGLLCVLAVWHRVLMDFTIHEHYWQTILHILHRLCFLQYFFVTKILSSGLGVGSLSSPPLAGWLFILSPMNIIYAVAVMVLLQVGTVGAMWVVTRGAHCCARK